VPVARHVAHLPVFYLVEIPVRHEAFGGRGWRIGGEAGEGNREKNDRDRKAEELHRVTSENADEEAEEEHEEKYKEGEGRNQWGKRMRRVSAMWLRGRSMRGRRHCPWKTGDRQLVIPRITSFA